MVGPAEDETCYFRVGVGFIQMMEHSEAAVLVALLPFDAHIASGCDLGQIASGRRRKQYLRSSVLCRKN